MVQLMMKVELRSSTMDNGEQFVMTSGISMLQVLFAECLALPVPLINLILEKAVDQYG